VPPAALDQGVGTTSAFRRRRGMPGAPGLMKRRIRHHTTDPCPTSRTTLVISTTLRWTS
jgi:hypothetical protein